MDGIHDMGGMDGFGKVEAEPNEPPFHDDVGRPRPGDAARDGLRRRPGTSTFALRAEKLPPVDYLDSSYYQRGSLALESNVSERGYVTPTRRSKAGHALRTASRCARTFTPTASNAGMTRGSSRASTQGHSQLHSRATACAPRTSIRRRTRGCRAMRATRSAWSSCQRLPRVSGLIAHGKGDNPQWLYTVVFDGRELWGPDADPTLKVSIDAFEPYLEKTVSRPSFRARRAGEPAIQEGTACSALNSGIAATAPGVRT